MKIFLKHLIASKKMFILFFSVSFVCLVIILLILYIIPFWDPAPAHSPSGKEFNPSSREDAHSSGRCTSTYNFYFILHHPSLGLSNSSLTLRKRARLFLSGRCPFFRALYLGIKFSLHPVSSLFGTQQQLTYPPVKSSTLPLRKMSVSQGVAPRHTIFTSSYIIPLWDSPTAHTHFGKELKLSSQEDAHFSWRCTSA